MAGENKFVKWNVKLHHPSERCETTVANSQCPNCKSNGTSHCVLHGGHSSLQVKNAKAVRNYRLTKWKSRIGKYANSDAVKSLREEVGILRMMLEEMLSSCEDATDLLLYSQRMSDLVMKIEKLVTSCDRLENRMGLLLSKDSVLQLAATYVQIINTHVSDPEIIESIGREIVDATEQIEDPLEA